MLRGVLKPLRAPPSRLPRRGLATQQAGKEASGSSEGPVAEELEEAAGGWFKEFFKSKLNIVAASALVLVGLNIGSSAAFDAYYQHQVVSTLERGVTPAIERPSALPREALRQKVLSVLHPQEPTRFYQILTGSPGSGKSTVVREACAAIGGGIGYVDVSPAFEIFDFGRDLGNAFNFRFEEHMGIFNVVSQMVLGTKVRDKGEEHPLSSLRRTAEALHSAASAYRRRTGRPFVLVLDSTDRLAREPDSTKAMEALLEYAREWAQAGVITTVFVTSDWSTMDKLRGVQPGSRAAPPVHIGGITQEEALQYMAALGVTGKTAEQCVGLVGGALLLLERCAGMCKAGVPFPDIKRTLYHMIEHGYETAGLLDATPQQEAGLQVVEAMLKSRSHVIPASQWRSMVPDRDMQQRLLKGGVLKYHDGEVMFESRLALSYARDGLFCQLAPEQREQHRGLGSTSRLEGWWRRWFG